LGGGSRPCAGGWHAHQELTRRDDGACRPAHLRVRIDANLILLKTFHLEVVSAYSDYRKFQSQSRIVE